MMGFRKSHWTRYFPYTNSDVGVKNVLHLGSGHQVIGNTVTLDIDENLNPDILWDMNKTPWPMSSDYFDEVIAINILEHVDDLLLVLSEIHRILKPGGKVYILVPHFSNYAAFVDPTHRQYLSAFSFDYCIGSTDLEREYGFYTEFKFSLNRRILTLSGWLLNIVFFHVVNSIPLAWEKYFCFLLRGEGIYLELSKDP